MVSVRVTYANGRGTSNTLSSRYLLNTKKVYLAANTLDFSVQYQINTPCQCNGGTDLLSLARNVENGKSGVASQLQVFRVSDAHKIAPNAPFRKLLTTCKAKLENIRTLGPGRRVTDNVLQSYHRPGARFPTPVRDHVGTKSLKFAPNDTHEMTTARSSHSTSPIPTSRFPLAFSPVPPQDTSTLMTDSMGYPSDPERQRDINEEQSGAEISFAARGKGDPRSGIPFYTGR
jgi:hypothetical protein